MFIEKSDNSFKTFKLKILKIGLSERLRIHTKKHLKRCIIKNGAAGKKVNSHWQKANGPLSRRKVQTSCFAKLPAKARHSFSPTIRSTLALPPQVRPCNITIKKSLHKGGLFLMVPLARIGLATPSLPMTCSTTELQRRQREKHTNNYLKNQV